MISGGSKIMTFLLPTPKWVKRFPYDADRVALMQLARASKGSFGKPREMNFVLYDFVDGKI
jgi:hypothetical protein